MEAFIQVVKQHEVLIGDRSHDLVYDLHEEEDEAQFRDLYPHGEYEKARSAPGPLVDAIAQSPFAAASLERGENWFLVTRIQGKDPAAPIYSLSSGAKGEGRGHAGDRTLERDTGCPGPLWDYRRGGLVSCSR